MNNENKELKESDFHHGEGHRIPISVKIAWLWMISIAIGYAFYYLFPSLQELWQNGK